MFTIISMGKAALLSHAEGAKHLVLALKGAQPGIVDFLSTSAEEPTVSGGVFTSEFLYPS